MAFTCSEPLVEPRPASFGGLVLSCSVAMSVTAPVLARAQTRTATAGPEVIVVRGQRRPIDDALAPRADHTLRLDDRPLRFESVGDVVAEVPGVLLLRRGGEGASEVLSIRGADFDQTTVLIDDVPIAGPDRGAVDFSLLPVGGFERIEVFRGSAPIRYGAGSVGGVVRLVPRQAQTRQLRAGVSAASYDTYRATVEGEGWIDGFSGVAAGGFVHADNDFIYLDDNATLADPSDDRRRARANAGLDQGHGFFVAGWEEGDHRLAVLGLVIEQARGLPGPATVVSLDSDQRRTRVFGSVGYRYRGDLAEIPLDAFVTVAGGWDRDRVRDRLGAIGQGREDTDDRYLSLDLRSGAFVEPIPGLRAGLTGFYRHDDIRPMNAFATPGDQPSRRDLGVVAGEVVAYDTWGELDLSLRGSASAQITRAGLTESRFQGTFSTELDAVAPSFGLEAQIDWTKGWSFTAQLASGLQLPTTLQLFGNRDTIEGNVELEPERALGLDLGVGYRGAVGPLQIVGRAQGFWLEVQDIILARRTAQNTVAFGNERTGTTVGLEGALDLELGKVLRSATSVTALDSRFDNRGFDRQQPLRAPFRLFERLTASLPLDGWLDAVSAFGEIDHRSGFFPDLANLVAQTSYTVVNAGLRAGADSGRWSAAVSARNLSDELGQDLLAFPRPGRTFELALEWRESL